MTGSDIARCLEYKNVNEAIRMHINEEYRSSWSQLCMDLEPENLISSTNLPSYFKPHTTMINESGLCQLIMRSKLPKAVIYQKWVYEEVLPSIHKTGKYSAQDATKIDSSSIQPMQIENYELKMELLRVKHEKELETVKQEAKNVEYEKSILEADKRAIESEKRALESERSTTMLLANRVMKDIAISMLLHDSSKNELGYIRKKIDDLIFCRGYFAIEP